jgi:hypothetical protein
MDLQEQKELMEHDKKGLMLSMKMALVLGEYQIFDEAYEKYVAILKQIRWLRKMERSRNNGASGG